MNQLTVTVIIIAVLLFLRFFCFSSPSDEKIKKNLKRQKEQALRPKPDNSLLRNRPIEGDFVLGKYKRKYVCWNIKEHFHCLICGGSGSGKSSSLIIPFILNNPNSILYAIDIKGELYELGINGTKADNRTCVFSPLDHSSWGFNVFYGLDTDSTPQDILETMQNIAFSLIKLDEKNKFWGQTARDMLISLLIYYYKTGRDFTSCIDAILGCPIRDQIEEISNNADPASNEAKHINSFVDMADETLLSVFSTLTTALTCFSDANLRWAFGEAPRKVSPKTLIDGKSIFLSIPEYKLTAWSGALTMMTNLTLAELSKRPSCKDAEHIVILLDELGRIVSGSGAMDGLIDYAMTLRSRKCHIIVALQTLSSLRQSFSESQILSLVGNLNIKILLDASESKMQKTFCEMCGKYVQRKQSKSLGKNMSNSYSFEEKDRLTYADLTDLTKNGEEVVITPLGYSMLHKCFYFSDAYFQTLIEQNKR